MEHMHDEREAAPHFADTKKTGMGPALAVVIIIVLVALAGLYYFTQEIQDIPRYESAETDPAVQALMEQSNSDAVADIEADVTATDLSEIDALLNDIEADLGGVQ